MFALGFTLHRLPLLFPRAKRAPAGWRLGLVGFGLWLGVSGAAPAQVPTEVGLNVVSGGPISDQVEALLQARWLKAHAQLWQFLTQPELTQAEFDDLLARAPSDLTALLQTRGYFNAEVRAQSTPAPELSVTLGPPTTIASVKVAVVDVNGADLPALSDEVNQRWSLQVGNPFTQSAWQGAKDTAVNTVARSVYYQAAIAESQATIDPRTQRADLSLRINAGPAFAFGPSQVVGVRRYSAQEVLNLAQLAGLSEGQAYSAQALFDAQRRIVDNGNYASAFVTLKPVASDTGNPSIGRLASTIEVGEKPLKQTEASIGASTDSGAKLHFTHTHYRLPVLGWQATHTLDWQRDAQTLSGSYLSPLDTRAWQWTGGLELKRQVDNDLTTQTQNWRAGRTQTLDDIQRTVYLQWVQSKEQVRTQSPVTTSAISGHWAWSAARWDNPSDPQTGHALSADLSAGVTLAQGSQPYLRGQTQWLWLRPFEQAQWGRVATRVGLGAVLASPDTEVPADALFLTGGDTSVRGYTGRSIGRVDSAQGLVLPGRLMWLGGVEWQRPTTWGGDLGRLEQTFFVDTAAVSDHLNDQKVYVGTGTGLRFISPVGPMQVDLAYGHQTQEWRLHLFVGIRF